LRSLVIAMKAVVMASSVWIIDLTMRTAVGEANGLGRVFVSVFLVAVIVTIVW